VIVEISWIEQALMKAAHDPKSKLEEYTKLTPGM